MDNSEMQKEILQLGRLFVKELNLEPGTDTLSKWMAFYLAEKIKKVENSEGVEKEAASKECFETILKLWEHRWTMPHGNRPLENFEPILNILQKLDPQKDEPYYFPIIPNNHRQRVSEQPVEGTTEYWIYVASLIDRNARILLQAFLKFAADTANDAKTKEWLENSVTLRDNLDTQIIRIIVNDDTLNDDGEIADKDFHKKYNLEKFKSYVDYLQRFQKLSEFLIQKFQKDILEIE